MQTAEFPAFAADRWTPVEIDLLDPNDWPVLRAARLAALHDSPCAFVATLAVEAGWADEQWVASIESSTWAVARAAGEVVGIACLVTADADCRMDYFIQSVWVTPMFRRQGLVRQMLWRLEGVARTRGAEYLKLWVLETNDTACDAYLKLDFFAVLDEVQASCKRRGDGTFVKERLMVKPLLGGYFPRP